MVELYRQELKSWSQRWRLNPELRDAQCGHLRNAVQVRQMDACEHCAADRFLPPFRYDGDTHTRLVDDVNAWFELSEDTSQLEANMVLVHHAFRGDDGP